MKAKLLLSCIFMSVLFAATAQQNIPKGSILLGGSISYNTHTDKNENGAETKYNNFFLSPSAGKAVKENLFVGLSLGFGFYDDSQNSGIVNPSIQENKGNQYSFGVFARKYKPLKNNFYLFLQSDAKATITDSKLTNTNSVVTQNGLGINLSLTPGVSYAFNSKLQMEAGLNDIFGIGYTNSKYNQTGPIPNSWERNSFNAFTTLNNFTSQLYIGFRLLLQKKEKAAPSVKAA